MKKEPAFEKNALAFGNNALAFGNNALAFGNTAPSFAPAFEGVRLDTLPRSSAFFAFAFVLQKMWFTYGLSHMVISYII